uniref:Uncharacterized protein n=1 Tax=Oryza sativa subsp. japonica TaxID=39947 RepID=Q6ESF5_ORYSJ|nr:hypothetical protein [Oryza sativa Japonica Group]
MRRQGRFGGQRRRGDPPSDLLASVESVASATSRSIHVSKFSVGFPDDDPDSDFSPDDPDLLRNRPVPDRLLVVSAGVAANLLFAFLIVYTQALIVGVPVQAQLPGILVSEVIPGSAAAGRPRCRTAGCWREERGDGEREEEEDEGSE